ncbi:hypothetical protein [Noviherbaspirillum massiliense]|uniref:hypothetical protein n=1 Tax=Noviherbaspirillum massiliense TaxID=1465823 RepID=UPI0002ECD39B|nr:hypothetical protein [Noviherbaspirillum massiliense]
MTNPRIFLHALTVLALAASLASAQADAGPAQTAGEHIDRAAASAGRGINKAMEKTGEALRKAGEKTGEALQKVGEKIEEVANKARS